MRQRSHLEFSLAVDVVSDSRCFGVCAVLCCVWFACVLCAARCFTVMRVLPTELVGRGGSPPMICRVWIVASLVLVAVLAVTVTVHAAAAAPTTASAAPSTAAAAVTSLSTPTPSALLASVCNDIPPPGSQYTCAQQKAFQDANPADNKCDQIWMAGYCLLSCGKCAPSSIPCVEQAPDSNSCQQQALWGKCGCPWMRTPTVTYCQCSCGPDAGLSSLPCADSTPTAGSSGITLTPAQVIASPSLAVLQIQSDASTNPKQPSAVYQPNSVGYVQRKSMVLQSLKTAGGLSQAASLMFFGIAMQETEALEGYDPGKSGAAENFSFFNLNRDLIESVTYAGYNCAALNDLANLDQTSSILSRALTKYGVNGLLNFIRGGRTGLDAWKAGQNDCAYDCLGYRAAIAAYVAIFDANPELLTDARRVAMDTKHE